MSDYKQYRTHAAISILAHQQVFMNEEPKDAVESAVAYADALIAELERTEAQDRLHGILAESPQDEPPALPRLNTGWKWAEVGHVVIKWDQWWMYQQVFAQEDGNTIGLHRIPEHFPLATPDWHNPENIEDPGEGYRFLVKREAARNGDEYFTGTYWTTNAEVNDWELRLWTHRTTRPLPPVLADEKEAQP